MIPAIQKGDPQWSELRAMGIGWWVRNINTLRRCIEKVLIIAYKLQLPVVRYALTGTHGDLCIADSFVLQPSQEPAELVLSMPTDLSSPGLQISLFSSKI